MFVQQAKRARRGFGARGYIGQNSLNPFWRLSTYVNMRPHLLPYLMFPPPPSRSQNSMVVMNLSKQNVGTEFVGNCGTHARGGGAKNMVDAS